MSRWPGVNWLTLSARVSSVRVAGWSLIRTSAPVTVLAQDLSAVRCSWSHAGPPGRHGSEQASNGNGHRTHRTGGVCIGEQAPSGLRHRTQNAPSKHTGEQAPSGHEQLTRNTMGPRTVEQAPSGHGHRTRNRPGAHTGEQAASDHRHRKHKTPRSHTAKQALSGHGHPTQEHAGRAHRRTSPKGPWMTQTRAHLGQPRNRYQQI